MIYKGGPAQKRVAIHQSAWDTLNYFASLGLFFFNNK